MEILKNDEMIDLLEVVHHALFPIYRAYSVDLVMDQSQFHQFAREFAIFPDVLPEAKVMKYFTTLSNFYVPNGNQNNELSSIDEHLFVEILALNALEMKF